MSDVRALLKAKRQESRITHPLASYSSSGQLRCSVCAMAVKHASAWEGHLGSKGHRMNVARLKQEQQRQQQQEREQQQGGGGEISLTASSSNVGEKRKSVDPESDSAASKKARVENASNGFPNDFFSDPSKAPIISSHPDSDSEDDDDDIRMSGLPPADSTTQPPSTNTNATPVDDEWERFQREVVNAPTTSVEEDASINKQEVYARATVAVDAEMVDVTQGIPEEVAANTENTAPTEEVVLDEAELRRRKELEEKELIMDRLLEEERVQEEADMKVVQMKNRLDALKKRREMRKKQGLLT